MQLCTTLCILLLTSQDRELQISRAGKEQKERDEERIYM